MLRAYSRPERVLRSLFGLLPFVDEKRFLLFNIRREVEQRKAQYPVEKIEQQQVESRAKREFNLAPIELSSRSTLGKIPQKLQFVFISIDIENIRGTIEAIDSYIDFVDSYIVVTSREKLSLFESIESLYPIVVIDESKILNEDIITFRSRDHQTKNWMLRASLLQLEVLQDIFIMLDDDNRPLRDISIEHFIYDEKYLGYYYYDLDAWHHNTSDYDFGQHNTRELLVSEGFERLSYSSHKPQIIDKSIFQEVVDRYYAIGVEMPIDEWSIYFNYAVAQYPQLFEKRKFDVLNWPDHPSRWEWVYKPDEYNFENYYKELYYEGLFSCKERFTTAEKIALKNKELEPYTKTQIVTKEWRKYFKEREFVHKVLQFQDNNSWLICYDLPYYQEVYQDSWLKIPLKYKVLSLNTKQVQLVYYLNGDLWHSSSVYVGDSDYFEGLLYLDIDCRTLERGFYSLLVDVMIEKQLIYAKKSPYLMGLKVL